MILYTYVKAVKSWVRFSGKKVDGKINIPESDNKYGNEKVPKPEEVQDH